MCSRKRSPNAVRTIWRRFRSKATRLSSKTVGIAARTERHALSQRAQSAFRAPAPLVLRRRHAARLPPRRGRASYRNRSVRTPKWLAEHDAGRALFGGFGRKLPDAPASTTQDGGVANTNIVFHAGRCSRSKRAIRRQDRPRTLEHVATHDQRTASPVPSPRIQGRSHHREWVPRYNAAGPLTPCPLLRIDQRGPQRDAIRAFRNALCHMVHDFIVTENHLVPILPITAASNSR